MHGDSLDDVEGFPEDHVTEHVHKLPHIAEVGYVLFHEFETVEILFIPQNFPINELNRIL